MTATRSHAPARPGPIFVLPPPVYFAVAFAGAMLLHALVPLPFPDFPWRIILGTGLLVIAIIGLGVLVGSFRKRRTTLNPFGSPATLLVDGPYRFSRNPMYLGLVAAYLGGCLLAQSVWPILLLTIPLAILSRVVIPYEEASLRTVFGADYDAYCARVGRWFSLPS